MGFLFAGATATVEQGKTDAARIRQAGSNERQAAESELARFSQSLSNKRTLDAAGEQINAMGENIARHVDAATYGRLGERVAAAERLGASLSEAAAAGVGGSSVDAYNETMKRADALGENMADRQLSSETIAAGRAAGQTMTDAVASMDNSVHNANLDFTKYVDAHKPSTLGQLVGIAATAAATYFGGPQAGAGVASLFDAGTQAEQGDFAGAGRSISSGVQGIFSGGNAYKAGADSKHISGRPWGDQIFSKTNSTRIK